MDESEQNEAKGKYTLKKTFVLPIFQIDGRNFQESLAMFGEIFRSFPVQTLEILDSK